MHPRRSLVAAALLLPLCAARAAEPGAAPAPPQAVQRQVDGAVASVDLNRHLVTVETATGQAELGWDRNTLIYQPGGATTAAALRPGVVVRAGVDPTGIASWIQLRQVTPPPPPSVEGGAAGPPRP